MPGMMSELILNVELALSLVHSAVVSTVNAESFGIKHTATIVLDAGNWRASDGFEWSGDERSGFYTFIVISSVIRFGYQRFRSLPQGWLNETATPSGCALYFQTVFAG